jgi:hypothetical protein
MLGGGPGGGREGKIGLGRVRKAVCDFRAFPRVAHGKSERARLDAAGFRAPGALPPEGIPLPYIWEHTARHAVDRPTLSYG